MNDDIYCDKCGKLLGLNSEVYAVDFGNINRYFCDEDCVIKFIQDVSISIVYLNKDGEIE